MKVDPFIKAIRLETNLSYSIDTSTDKLSEWSVSNIKDVRMKPKPWYRKLKFGPFRRVKR